MLAEYWQAKQAVDILDFKQLLEEFSTMDKLRKLPIDLLSPELRSVVEELRVSSDTAPKVRELLTLLDKNFPPLPWNIREANKLESLLATTVTSIQQKEVLLEVIANLRNQGTRWPDAV